MNFTVRFFCEIHLYLSELFMSWKFAGTSVGSRGIFTWHRINSGSEGIRNSTKVNQKVDQVEVKWRMMKDVYALTTRMICEKKWRIRTNTSTICSCMFLSLCESFKAIRIPKLLLCDSAATNSKTSWLPITLHSLLVPLHLAVSSNPASIHIIHHIFV